MELQKRFEWYVLLENPSYKALRDFDKCEIVQNDRNIIF